MDGFFTKNLFPTGSFERNEWMSNPSGSTLTVTAPESEMQMLSHPICASRFSTEGCGNRPKRSSPEEMTQTFGATIVRNAFELEVRLPWWGESSMSLLTLGPVSSKSSFSPISSRSPGNRMDVPACSHERKWVCFCER